MSKTVRIAMWSGPRNISTAMLRSWGNRGDAFVCDEPLYAHYLQQTGIVHPGRDEIIGQHEPDWRKVVDCLCGPIPNGKTVFYQKHMAHHLLKNIGRDWLSGLTHCFLIREPQEMLTSLLKRLPNPTFEDTGLPQQIEILDYVQRETGKTPPIIDAKDVLEDPKGMLTKLCHAVGIGFTDEMLSWPAGPRETDGIWAKYWYDAVEKSTGFQAYKPKGENVPDEMADLLAKCVGCYHGLHALRLLPEET